jgi:hypothetical protein
MAQQQVQQLAGLAGDRHGLGASEEFARYGVELEAVEAEYRVFVRHLAKPPVRSAIPDRFSTIGENTQGEVAEPGG